MPYYYDVTRETTTNSTTQTLSTHFRAVTVANQETCRVMGLYGVGRHSTAGGGYIYGIRPGAAGSGGTGATESKKKPTDPAASTTWFDDASAITPGTSPVTQIIAGIAQTGGQGGWVALEPDMGLALMPNAGANGNCEVGSKAVGTSVPIVVAVDFREG